MDDALVALGGLDRLRRVLGRQYPVAALLQDLADELPQALLVLHQQHGFRAAPRGRGRRRLLHLALHDGHLAGVNERDRPFVTGEFLSGAGLALDAAGWRDKLAKAEAMGATAVAYQPYAATYNVALMRDAGATALAAAHGHLERRFPRLQVRERLVAGSGAKALIKASRAASAVVVSRNHAAPDAPALRWPASAGELRRPSSVWKKEEI